MFTDIQDLSTGPEGGPAAEPARDGRPWFDVAHELARTGQYADVDEVEAAISARDPSLVPSRNAIARDAIDIACRRMRDEAWWA
ncbi:hypothetical protein [Sphingosinicella sp. CPCC 101087]|uniref:hypothetical protein n=1 Tax=Sphingosinicella sp. CPCC 101087 TaxID=2497754 RepID=UPI00101D0C71|nr:hypothetical protein [Sphingosinicella sp. CPCC 101087]